eukprot:scaffold66490_cov41-Phaeocystis_antarctica.AAC.5
MHRSRAGTLPSGHYDHVAMPPGLSLTEATRRTRRPSAARPRSMTRPSTLVGVGLGLGSGLG